ncbi:MAG: phosphate propanoyltransferase [Firmicutes bacterium]|nr:phosphate propanoyltransferase [Bacillota bacterium]
MKIMCEVSVRHVHLSSQHLQKLFGIDELTPVRDLSQPGQYLAAERVDLVGPKSTLKNVAIIGPTRGETQVEVSITDGFALGLKNIPVRQSGELDETPGITIRALGGEAELPRGVIIARRHIHLDTKTAGENGFTDGQIVGLEFDTERGGRLDGAIVRVSDKFAPAVHIDSDEANAMRYISGTSVFVLP